MLFFRRPCAAHFKAVKYLIAMHHSAPAPVEIDMVNYIRPFRPNAEARDSGVMWLTPQGVFFARKRRKTGPSDDYDGQLSP
jgi:hypothetical protein